MQKKYIIQAAAILTLLGLSSCEEPHHIYLCTPGYQYCADDATLTVCTHDGRKEEVPCSPDEQCISDGKSASCVPYECNPLEHTPTCEGNAIVYCIDYLKVPYDCGDITKYKCVPDPKTNIAACIAQNDSVAVCQQGEARCSPMNSSRQVCNNGIWLDAPCGTDQQCIDGVCENIPDCKDGQQDCVPNTDGTTTHFNCENGQWVKNAICTAEQTCTKKAGCIDANVEEGNECDETSQDYCAGDFFYTCVDGKYVAQPCAEADGKLCLKQQDTGLDLCVTDISNMGCTNEYGQSVSCCANGNGSKILSSNCIAGELTYWVCRDVNGTLYATEHQATSLCRNEHKRAYCLPNVSLVQDEVCPSGCTNAKDLSSAICHGNSVGDTCNANYTNRCIDTKTERVCENSTIVERTCPEGYFCRSNGCVQDVLPQEGEPCALGSHGICVTTDADTQYFECVDGIYKARPCSTQDGEVCLTRSSLEGGDVCAQDVSTMTCSSMDTGESVPCCKSGNGRIFSEACVDNKVMYWQCVDTNYATVHYVESTCISGKQQISCNENSKRVVTDCPTGCQVTSETTSVCRGANVGDSCDPTTYAAHCTNANTQRYCTNDGIIAEATCAEGQMCLTNTCESTSMPTVGSACNANSPSYCIGEYAVLECVNNIYQSNDCRNNKTSLCQTYQGNGKCVVDLSPGCGGQPCCPDSSSFLMYNNAKCTNNFYEYIQCIFIDGTAYGLLSQASGMCTYDGLLTCAPDGSITKIQCEATGQICTGLHGQNYCQ